VVSFDEFGMECEGLVNVRMTSPGDIEATIEGSEGVPARVCSLDTIVASPGHRLTLNVAKGAAGLALMFMAR
jgi:hypothetical protein